MSETEYLFNTSAVQSGGNRSRRGTWRAAGVKVFTSLLCLLAAFILISTAVGALRYNTALPIWDEWENLGRFRAWVTRGYPIEEVFIQHNDHIIFIPNIFFFVDYFLFKGTEIFTGICMMLCQMILLLVQIITIHRTITDKQQKIILTCFSCIILFSLRQFDNFYWHFELQFLLVLMTSSVAISLYAASALRPGEAPDKRGMGFAFLFAAMAPFTMSNGLLCPLMLAFLAFVLNVSRRAKVITIFVVCIIVVAFALNYRPNAVLIDQGGWTRVIVAFLRFLTAYLGNISGNNLRVAQALGFFGLVLTVLMSFVMLNGGRRNFTLTTQFGITLFIVASACVTALGRMHGGSTGALSSRYVTPSALFWSATAIFWANAPLPHFALRRARLFALVAASVAIGVGASYEHVRNLRTLPGNYLSQRLTSDALLTGIFVPAIMADVYDDRNIVMPMIDFLRARKISIFADPSDRLQGHPLSEAGSLTEGLCHTSMQLSQLDEDATPMGLGIAGTIECAAAYDEFARVFVVRSDGIIGGYGTIYKHTGTQALWRGFATATRGDKLRAAIQRSRGDILLLEGTVAVP